MRCVISTMFGSCFSFFLKTFIFFIFLFLCFFMFLIIILYNKNKVFLFHFCIFFYVAFSCVKAPANVKVQLPDTVHGRIGFMRNVVYEETLLSGCMHLLNGSVRSYIHNVQLFKIECLFEINTV
jgi:hypothetical protein